MTNSTNSTKHAVLSLSGGMDSSSLLAELVASGDYDMIHCFNFDYGQRHSIELERAQQVVEFWHEHGYDVTLQTINLRDAFSDSQSALGANKTLDVPKEEYKHENLMATVVENRNVIFSSIIYGKALAISKKFDVDVDISLGVHNNDDSVYPDCRPESVNMARELFRISNYGSERISYHTPFILLTKYEVLEHGVKSLEAIGLEISLEKSVMEYYNLTHSCYSPEVVDGKVYACGTCATCRDRLEAFEKAGLEDPVEYINSESVSV